MTKRVLVVGGGVGGLALAAGLVQRNVDVVVVERAPKLSPVGAGIVLGVNAHVVLRALGVADAIEKHGRFVRNMLVTDVGGRVLQDIDSAPLQEWGRIIAIHRADLHEALVGGLGHDRLRLGVTITSLADDGRGVDVAFTDGTRDRFDAVIGADGVKSEVRRQVFGEFPLRYSGYTCWRFVIPNRTGLTDPVERWGRGVRIGLVPLSEDRLYAFFVLDAPRGSPDLAKQDLAAWKRLWASFADVDAVLGEIRSADQLIHHDLEEIEVPRWSQGRIALIGDAAHAMTPNMGQGAAMAIEDAWVLAEKLATIADPAEALAAYEAHRRPRATDIQKRSRLLGKVAQWSNPIATSVRDTLFRLTPKATLSNQLRHVLFGEKALATLLRPRA